VAGTEGVLGHDRNGLTAPAIVGEGSHDDESGCRRRGDIDRVAPVIDGVTVSVAVSVWLPAVRGAEGANAAAQGAVGWQRRLAVAAGEWTVPRPGPCC
jgi:hypothetical protein